MNILDICNKTRGYVRTLQIALFFLVNIPLISPFSVNIKSFLPILYFLIYNYLSLVYCGPLYQYYSNTRKSMEADKISDRLDGE